MAHTYNGPGWDQRGLVAFFVFYLETFAGWRGGGFGGWWKRPYLASSVPPGPPCQPQPPDHLQSGISNTDSVCRGCAFYSVLCGGCVFFVSPFSVRKKKETCSQPDAFLVAKFYAPVALVGCKCKFLNPNVEVIRYIIHCYNISNVISQFLNPTIQRAGHHTARVKSHGGLKKDNKQY